MSIAAIVAVVFLLYLMVGVYTFRCARDRRYRAYVAEHGSNLSLIEIYRKYNNVGYRNRDDFQDSTILGVIWPIWIFYVVVRFLAHLVRGRRIVQAPTMRRHREVLTKINDLRAKAGETLALASQFENDDKSNNYQLLADIANDMIRQADELGKLKS